MEDVKEKDFLVVSTVSNGEPGSNPSSAFREISQENCERNPSLSRGALEDRVRQAKICEQGGGKRNNGSVRGITNHHRH